MAVFISRIVDLCNEQVNQFYFNNDQQTGKWFFYFEIIKFITIRQKQFYNQFTHFSPQEDLKDCKKMILQNLRKMIEVNKKRIDILEAKKKVKISDFIKENDEFIDNYLINNCVKKHNEKKKYREKIVKLIVDKTGSELKKINKYLLAIISLLKGDNKYFIANGTITNVENILLKFCLIVDEKTDKKQDLNAFETIYKEIKLSEEKKALYIEKYKNIEDDYSFYGANSKMLLLIKIYNKLNLFTNLSNGFDRLKAQRQITKKDFQNKGHQQKKKFDDSDKKISSTHPFWYDVQDIDNIIDFHQKYFDNYKKIKKKREYYVKITGNFL